MMANRVLRKNGERMLRNQTFTDRRMGLDDVVLIIRKTRGLVQNRVRHAYLAEIMQKPADADPRNLVTGQSGLLGEQSREPRNAP